MSNIGIGISDFKMLRVRKNYYIDKTMYIKHIIDNQAGVILVTRPRRFGKTLNMSMLKYYFDCKAKDSKELFRDLKIMKQGKEYTSKTASRPQSNCADCWLFLIDVGAYYAVFVLYGRESVLQILQDVLNMLCPDGQSNGPGSDALVRQFRRIQLTVGGGGGVND